MGFYRRHDDVGAAAAELAGCLWRNLVSEIVFQGEERKSEEHKGKTYSGAHLDVKPSNRVPIIHGVEGCHFIYSHRWHL